MKVAVCYNRVPPKLRRGEAADRISEEGAADEAKAVRRALRELGHDAELIPLGSDPGKFLTALRTAKPAAVFNLCEGFWGDSRKELHVAALLELAGFPYSGSTPLCLGLSQDKARTKDLLVRHKLPTPPYTLVEPGTSFHALNDLVFPLIVKPRSEDASLGITHESIVEDTAALHARIRYVHQTYHQGALIEEFIAGREINAAVLGNDPGEPLPPSEIIFQPGLPRAIVSYAGKWLEQSQEYSGTVPVCPAPLDQQEAERIRDVTLKAYALLGCRDYARVDMRLRDGIPFILEINANPDISPGAGLARAAAAHGLPYPVLIGRILDMTLFRKEQQRARP